MSVSGLDPVELSRARDELLRRLYVAYFTTEDDLVMVREIQQEHGWDDRVFWRALESLSEDGLARQVDSGPRFKIKPAGVLRSERLQLVSPELISANRKVRPIILARYAEAYETHGAPGERHYREVVTAVASATSIEPVLIEANQQHLCDVGELSDDCSVGYLKITPLGRRVVRDLKKIVDLAHAFEALQVSTSPHERGRQFQKLVGQLAREEGWRVEESALAPGEEIDLVLDREDSFYLLECRWKNEPVSAKEIRDFAGKLQKRAAVPGVFVSMSGYTKDAAEWVESVTGETPIMLVGPDEVADLFNGALGFNKILTEKKRSLVRQRKAPWR